jgi:hypothetical protein
VSHPESRWLMRAEIANLLDVEGDVLGTLGPYAQESIAAAASARRLFGHADVDRSGLLVGSEIEKVGGARVDFDGDGRVTLAELARAAEDYKGSAVLESEPIADPEERVSPDGDLSRLLDGIDPFDFERKKDGQLDRKEAERAVFAALDLDGSKRLDLHELSRHPGPLRELRFGDRAGLARFEALDRSGGGSIGPREFTLRDEDWRLLDRDDDGFCQLDPTRFASRRAREVVSRDTEWPSRRRGPRLDLPPGSSVESICEGLDADGDGQLTKRECRRRPLLFAQLDVDRSSIVEPDELERAEAVLLRWGVESGPDDFFTRWDLDGSGRVDEDEVSSVVWTLLERRGRR